MQSLPASAKGTSGGKKQEERKEHAVIHVQLSRDFFGGGNLQ